MTGRPHSVDPRPPGLETMRFTERNNFLFLLLGLISASEQIIRVLPGLGEAPAAADDLPGDGARPQKVRRDSILR
jgi:hypothetical protein